MKWNLRWAAARRDIWRPTQLLAAFEEVGFTPSLSKVAAMWSNKPVTIRLDDLDKICAALDCTPNDLLEPEPEQHRAGRDETRPQAVGERQRPAGTARPTPRPGSGGSRRGLPPN